MSLSKKAIKKPTKQPTNDVQNKQNLEYKCEITHGKENFGNIKGTLLKDISEAAFKNICKQNKFTADTLKKPYSFVVATNADDKKIKKYFSGRFKNGDRVVTEKIIRRFKIKYHDEQIGKCKGCKPKQAARKAVSTISNYLIEKGLKGDGIEHEFSIIESTRNSLFKKKERYYTGMRELLDKPNIINVKKKKLNKETGKIEEKVEQVKYAKNITVKMDKSKNPKKKNNDEKKIKQNEKVVKETKVVKEDKPLKKEKVVKKEKPPKTEKVVKKTQEVKKEKPSKKGKVVKEKKNK